VMGLPCSLTAASRAAALSLRIVEYCGRAELLSS